MLLHETLLPFEKSLDSSGSSADEWSARQMLGLPQRAPPVPQSGLPLVWREMLDLLSCCVASFVGSQSLRTETEAQNFFCYGV